MTHEPPAPAGSNRLAKAGIVLLVLVATTASGLIFGYALWRGIVAALLIIMLLALLMIIPIIAAPLFKNTEEQ